ncbi:MAG: phosphoribosylaminoimidazolesuccinocarboxamide synthase [Chthoniobacterales bacterium]
MDLLECNLPDVPKLRSGKVREVFDLGETLLIVATDRISAFDCILPNAIPQKGAVLSQISKFWFQKLNFVPNHLLIEEFSRFPEKLQPYKEQLASRSMIVKKATPLPVECVVRGYLAGSGWKDYQQEGQIGGHSLPPGLQLADRLPETLFTPSTKAEEGHDASITWNECRKMVGDDIAEQARGWSIELYEHGRAYAAQRGIIIADTKFEFGLINGELVLIDECMTPDSSRFWPESQYQAGKNPPSFDKQFVRDYLETLDWDKTPPAPSLPPDIVAKTAEKYRQAYELLTGRGLS